MIDKRITKTATTLTIGNWFGRERFARIQIGSVSCPTDRERRHDHLVERKREREQRAGDDRRRDLWSRHVAERLPRVGAEIHGRLVERARHPPHSCDRVVVDDDDAERGMPDDDREQAEIDPQRPERGVQRHPGHDPGERDREDDQERDRLPPEEAIARHRDCGERPQQHCQCRGTEPGLDRRPKSIPDPGIVYGLLEPLERQPCDRPVVRPPFVERVQADDDERQVDEGEGQRSRPLEEPLEPT